MVNIDLDQEKGFFEGVMGRMPKKTMLKVAVGVFALMVLFNTFYIVQDGTVGVLSTLGKYDESAQTAGAHLKIPFVQNVYIMDVKNQTVNYKGQGETPLFGNGGVINKPYITVLDGKNLPVSFDLSVQFAPVAEEMPYILKKWGVNYFDKIINNTIRSSVRDAAGKYDAETIALRREEITESIKSNLRNRFEKLPFTIVDVSLRNISLPPSVREKAIKVQEAKQKEQELVMQERQAEVTKRIEIINAQREAEKRIIAAKAKADAIKLESDAIADANKKVGASLTPLLVKQHTIEAWNGEYPRIVSDAGMLLQVGDEAKK